jgi:hypothetical protein
MSLNLPGVVGWALVLTVAVLTIVGTLLQHAGITSRITPRGVRQRPVGANLTFGAGLGLLCGTTLVPDAYQRIWGSVLILVAICLFIAMAVILGISRRAAIPGSGT